MTAPIDMEALREHTPGPWVLSYDQGRSRDVVASPDPLPICSVRISWVGNEQYAANARLIAAAPTLLAELTTRRARDAEVEALVEMAQLVHDECDAHNDFAIDAKRRLRIAIAPFTGGQSMTTQGK